nr:hypothetical protein [Streptomyces cupreus]
MYLVVPLVLLALLYAASGVAAVARGWVLPMHRKRVHRRGLFGCGQLVVAFALCWQTIFGLVLEDLDTRTWGTLTGSVLLVAGVIVMAVSQRAGGNRQGGTAL